MGRSKSDSVAVVVAVLLCSSAVTAIAQAPSRVPASAYFYCYAVVDQKTIYFSDPFEVPNGTRATWNTAFSQFLADKYSVKAAATCSGGVTPEQAKTTRQRQIESLGRSRAIIQTNWKWDSSSAVAVARNAPAPEPVAAATRPPAPANTPAAAPPPAPPAPPTSTPAPAPNVSRPVPAPQPPASTRVQPPNQTGTTPPARGATALEVSVRGDALYEAKNYAQAIDTYKSALTLSPSTDLAASIHNMIGSSWLKLKQWRDAEVSFKEGIRLKSTSANSYFGAGVALHNQEKYAEAVPLYVKGLQLKPDSQVDLYRLGVAYEELKENDKALEVFNKALSLVPDDPEVLYELGTVHRREKHYDEALKMYRAAIQADKDFEDAYYWLGETLTELKRYPEAVQAYQQTLRINPNSQVAMVELGVAYVDLKQYPDAIAQLLHAVQLEPKDDLAWYFLGKAYVLTGNKQEGMKVYRALVAIDDKEDAENLLDLLNGLPSTPPAK